MKVSLSSGPVTPTVTGSLARAVLSPTWRDLDFAYSESESGRTGRAQSCMFACLDGRPVKCSDGNLRAQKRALGAVTRRWLVFRDSARRAEARGVRATLFRSHQSFGRVADTDNWPPSTWRSVAQLTTAETFGSATRQLRQCQRPDLIEQDGERSCETVAQQAAKSVLRGPPSRSMSTADARGPVIPVAANADGGGFTPDGGKSSPLAPALRHAACCAVTY